MGFVVVTEFGLEFWLGLYYSTDESNRKSINRDSITSY
jgi:hypothetical protein